MTDKYILMHKDIPVANLVLDNTTNLIIGYKPLNPEHSPFLGTCDIDKIKKWWAMRSIPASREMMQQVIRNAGCINAEGYLAKNLALSMTDSYWICPIDMSLEYKDVNLRNFTDLDIDRVPYHNDTSIDPNASLTGQMDKYWDLSGRYPVLVKNSTAHYGQQALNEVMATIIHEKQHTDVPYTKYRAEKIEDGGYACRCRAFTSDGLEFVPALEVIDGGHISNDTNYYNGYIDICEEHGIDREIMQRFMDYQTLTDFILSNEDEHLANFGILRDPDTLEFISPAPIYDTGNSMSFRDSRRTPYTRAELLERKVTGFYPTEEKMLANIKNKDIVDMDLLPSADEVKEFYIDGGIPKAKASVIAANYYTKEEMSHDLQKGMKISLYHEKQKEKQNTRDSLSKDKSSGIELTVIAGIPGSDKSDTVEKLTHEADNKGQDFIPEENLYPVDKIDSENPWIIDTDKILSSVQKNQDHRGSAYTVIRPNDIREERRAAGLEEDDTIVFATAYARTKQALLNGINVIYSATNLDKASRNSIMHIISDMDNIDTKLIVRYAEPKEIRREKRSDESLLKLENMAAKLHNYPPESSEGWMEIETIGTDPYKEQGYVEERTSVQQDQEREWEYKR